jgi:thioredoxin-like negative regulator of GroEL
VFEQFFGRGGGNAGGGFHFNFGGGGGGRQQQQQQQQELADLYEKAEHVSKLGRNSFRSRVEKNAAGDVWLVQFYSHQSSACRQFEAALDDLAGKVKSFARVGALNAEMNAELAHIHSVSSYPAFLLFAPTLDKPLVYSGSLTAKSLNDWLANR